MTCQLQWVGIIQWWCQLDQSSQAAWVQAIGSILAIVVAIIIPQWQRRTEKVEAAAHSRKVVMSAAANLDIALGYEAEIFDFVPRSEGDVSHNFTLDQAREFMKLRPQTRDALQDAIDKSHYFDERLCESIVRLGIKAATYERIVDELARRTVNADANAFFKKIQTANKAIAADVAEVRELLKLYLPKEISEQNAKPKS
jgi:hypothetical protein